MRLKKCKSCREEFTPLRTLQAVCSPACAIRHAEAVRASEKSRAAKLERAEHRKAREKTKTRGEWMREAQVAFNAYIRERDRDFPCISCGRFHDGQWHAGHYRATSVAPALRFNEENVHKQCAPCNNYLHGNLLEYRINLIRRIGQDKVDWLEGNHEPAKYSIEELKSIKRNYSLITRELKKGKENV